MKLSKAQQDVMDKAKKDIDEARALDYPEWLRRDSYYQIPKWADKETAELIEKRWMDAVNREYLKEYWEAEKNGIVLTHCNTRTLKKLEALGLIEILYDSTGDGGYGIDHVKILNY